MAERLWAPWRMKYIERPSECEGSGDIFVDLPAASDDRASLILYRGSVSFVMMNAFPYTNGHLLVAPYRQVACIEDLTDPEMLEIQQLVARAVRWLKASSHPDGFNIGVNLGKAAGAGIPQHVHWHVVPRWNGDTNFMSTVGDVRVLPQSLEDSYDRLRETLVDDD